MRIISIALVAMACQSAGSTPPRALELVEAPPTTDLAGYVAPMVARAQADGVTLVVYVGASWCEPCQHFHDAAIAHKLDAEFGGVRIVVFDAERDEQALAAAGYRPTMLPLFALPGSDGRASGKQFQGSIKGAGAVAEIAPHLRALVGR